jgi:Cysteine-rich CPCC
MPDAELIRAIRAGADALRFESPTRGAIALTTLRWGLPASEMPPGLSEAEIAFAIIRRTIRHSHRVDAGLDQYGNGSWLAFSRHVSEGDRRWDFEVDVAIDLQGQAMITDVRVVRPDDDVPDPDDPDAEPIAPRAPLTAADLLPHGMLACPCCGHATLSERGFYQICPVCFWEDDTVQLRWPDWASGANRTSLVEAQRNFRRFGACDDRSLAYVRPATLAERPSPDWRPIDPVRDQFEPPGVQMVGWPEDRTCLYWWRLDAAGRDNRRDHRPGVSVAGDDLGKVLLVRERQATGGSRHRTSGVGSAP